MTLTSERPLRPRLRRIAWQSGHATLTRLLGLPAPTSHYTVHRGLRIPMRDGVELVADHYAPTGTAKGTLLVRGPYGRGFPFSVLYTRVYAAHGYHVVMQSVRGTADSTGEFQPLVHETADGVDTVEWLRRQPWFTGRFATIGQSYLGSTQWALLMDPPPELAAAVITAGPHDFATSVWDTGAFRLTDSLGWADVMAHQDHGGGRLRGLIWAAQTRRRLARATAALPLGDAARELLGEGAAWFDSWLRHHDPDHPYWEPLRFGAALDRARVPVLLIGGWQDTFLRQTVEQYERLRARGADVGLTVGPWTHAQLTTTGAGRAARESLEWLDRHLAGGQVPARKPVRVYISGDRWTELAQWPPRTSETVFYLGPHAVLTDSAPPDTGGSSSFTYDPAQPTSTIGGPLLLAPKSGYRDDTAMAERHDVLTFTSQPLRSDLYVMGSPVVEIAHTADIPHVDLFVRLSEVDERGRSRNVTESYRRLTATSEPVEVRIRLDPTAHRFRAGSRIRVLVAGGAHPLFSRNLGTGEPTSTAARYVAATHTVYHGADGISRLVLPSSPARP